MAEAEEAIAPDDIMALIAADAFIAAIKPRLSTAPPDPLGQALLALHNTGRIKLLDLVGTASFAALAGHRFYHVQAFFSALVPGMTDTVPTVLAFTEALEPREGQTGSMGGVRTSLREWLAADPARAAEAVELAETGDVRASAVLAVTLQALGDLDVARRLATTDLRLRSEALHALGWMPHSDSAERQSTIEVLSGLAPGANDALSAQLLTTAVEVFNQAKACMDASAFDLIDRLLADPGGQTRRQAAQALWSAAGTLNEAQILRVLGCLSSVTPDEGEILRTLDMGLYTLVDQGHVGVVIDFLGRLLGNDQVEISLSAFDMVAHHLMSQPATRDRVLVDWLLTPGRSLGAGITEILPHGEDIVFERTFSLTDGTLSAAKLYALCLRTIGHLYLRPVLAASVLVAVLDGADKMLASSVEELLFDPMLVNYGGDLQAWLEGIPKSDPAYAGVRRALKRKTAYLAGLAKVSDVKELRPPERHRQAEYDKHSDDMRRSFGAAQARSPLLSMISRSVVLYGLQMTSVVTDFDGRRRLQESQLSTHSTVIEVPRSSILDPFGLEEMLLIFQSWEIPA